jgi:hypothetical protein
MNPQHNAVPEAKFALPTRYTVVVIAILTLCRGAGVLAYEIVEVGCN